MKNRRARTAAVTAVGLAALALGPAPGAQSPNPVRNDVPRVGQQEVVMMRHAYLEFLRGEPYGSPPVYAPGLEENYRPVR